MATYIKCARISPRFSLACTLVPLPFVMVYCRRRRWPKVINYDLTENVRDKYIHMFRHARISMRVRVASGMSFLLCKINRFADTWIFLFR